MLESAFAAVGVRTYLDSLTLGRNGKVGVKYVIRIGVFIIVTRVACVVAIACVVSSRLCLKDWVWDFKTTCSQWLYLIYTWMDPWYIV